jgi:3-hydroxybutyryl-CoA dehydrogenase
MEKIGIVGTGNIGSCNATLSIGNGFETVFVAYDEAQKNRGLGIIEQNFADLKAAGFVSDANIDAAMKLLKVTYDYKDLADCDFIFETVFEDVNVKAEVYEKLEAIVGEDVIIASTTSSLTAAILAVHIKHKKRFLVAHPFQPTHLQPLIELSGNVETTPENLEKAKQILERMKRAVVILHKELPGFIGNRLAQALFRESIYMIEQGMASADDIDKAIKYVVGLRYGAIGLLEYYDFVGFELERDIALNVYPTLCNATGIQETTKKGLADGNTGLASGKGLYDWSKKDRNDFRIRRNKPFLDIFDWNLPH